MRMAILPGMPRQILIRIWTEYGHNQQAGTLTSMQDLDRVRRWGGVRRECRDVHGGQCRPASDRLVHTHEKARRAPESLTGLDAISRKAN